MSQRKRISVSTGALVASTNKLNHIKSKRLDVAVKYTKSALGNLIISQEVTGTRALAY